MAGPARVDAYKWHGVWDEGAGGWQEFFGDPPEYGGLPPRDLTAEDTATFNKDQWASIQSAAGQRLYTPKGAPPAKKTAVKTKTKTTKTTDSPPAEDVDESPEPDHNDDFTEPTTDGADGDATP